ncbi:HPP family protein [Candidatus Palauibacter sp.]|uniref:CBS domain-containing protein n=1 Tax=Candidatus Palauibacter sp. TaxID=3101350 RepID=UPI003AF2E9F9
MKVREIMTRKVTTAGPSMALREAADVLVRRRLRAVPVIDEEGHVLGMLTDGQLMTHFLPALEEPGGGSAVLGAVTGNVRDIMERTVMCVNEDEPLANVVRLMLDKEIERLPVVREGQLVGFLTRGDIIRLLLRRDMDEATQDNKTED